MEAQMEKEVLQIKVLGVDWPNCAASLQEEVKKVDGVESAEYNIATSQLKIAGKGPKVNRQTIVQVVEKLGHTVEVEDISKSAVLHIEGMDCEDEVSLIQKQMKGLKGLEFFQVDLMSRALRVQYDPGLLSVQELVGLGAKGRVSGQEFFIGGMRLFADTVILNGLRLLKQRD